KILQKFGVYEENFVKPETDSKPISLRQYNHEDDTSMDINAQNNYTGSMSQNIQTIISTTLYFSLLFSNYLRNFMKFMISKSIIQLSGKLVKLVMTDSLGVLIVPSLYIYTKINYVNVYKNFDNEDLPIRE
ncbi:5865_t:CDS:2, partial [Dentiscutata heterogama]